MINRLASPQLLIVGFGYTAHYVTQKARQAGMSVMGTTRNEALLGYNARYDCELIHFSEKSIESALKKASHILISAPPIPDVGDPMLAHFSDLLKKNIKHVRWIGYLSSTGVYGDHQGNWVNESSPLLSLGSQGKLRLFVEEQWISFASAYQLPLTIFRLAGIYGPQRNALARLMAGKSETVVKEGHFFSRIHVEDIASAVLLAMQHLKKGATIYNMADDEPAPSNEVDDYAASLLGLAPLKKIPHELATLSPMAKVFYSQNKRVSNVKVKSELSLQWMYPTYREGLTHLLNSERYE